MRKPHALEPTKSNEHPRYMVFVDSESRVIDLEHKPYLIIAEFVDTRNWKIKRKEYSNPRHLTSFWGDVTKFGGRYGKVYVYAHNMFYDLVATGGINRVCKEGFFVESYFEKGTTFLLNFVKKRMVWNKEKTRKVERTQKTIVCVSTTNYFSESLASLAKTFNLKKLDFEYNAGGLDEAIIYCRRDVEIIRVAMKSLIEFVENENLGPFSRTLPGQSFTAFRHRFMKEIIYIHDNQEALDLEREAYSGGRVECFKIGDFSGDFYLYDVNSMYPYVMQEYEFPVSLRTYVTRSSIDYVRQLLDEGLLLICRCRVKTEDPLFAVKLGDGLIFPVGEFYAYLSTPELKMALERGLVLETFELAVYNPGRVFESFVNYFYTKRLEAKNEGDKVRDKLYKLILNSLYGKFGQKADDWERIGPAAIDEIKVYDRLDIETGKWDSFKIFGGSCFQKMGEEESFNSFPGVAAHVTAYARQTLLNFIEIAGWENIYYGDTDSLIVNETGHKRLLPWHDQKTLGKIKEEKRDKRLVINCPKDYLFAGEVKRKGIKKDAKQVNEITFDTTVWPKINSCIRAGNLDNYSNIKRTKVLTRAYTKGWVDLVGNMFPFRLTIEENKNVILPVNFKTRDFLRMEKGRPIARNQKDIIMKKYKGNISTKWTEK